ncbi:alpha/beta fold hydrolase [Streptomyces microflavus]|uniref:alpha/beta fold hydrolase n=1 Tax=Streptomyces microflavus TaxID=1919 RepID=UPI003322047B
MARRAQPGKVEEQVALFSAGMLVGTDAQLAMFDRIDVREDLRSITVPTLVISPLADLITTPFHSREIADGIPHAELVTLDCGHAIAAERPEAWADAMTKFLTTLPHAVEPASTGRNPHRCPGAARPRAPVT